MRRTILQAMISVAMSTMGCHRTYEISGDIVVTPAAIRRAQLPAVLCVGTGGSLATSSVHGHPAGRSPGRLGATLFCSEPNVTQVFELAEAIYYGSLPRRAHAYAWLVPVPSGESLCAGASETVGLDDQALNQIMLSSMRSERHRGTPQLGSWPCAENPSSATPMAFGVTFDPEHRTWEEAEGGRWIERRVLRIE